MAARRTAAAATTTEQEIPLSALTVGDLNMRSQMGEGELTDLAASMSAVGLINAVQVLPTESGYELVAGHRRCAAAELLGWTTIRARILSSDPLQAAAIAWTENHAREGVTVMDQARWIRAMMDRTHATQATTATMLSISPSHLSEVLATLSYPEELQEALGAGAINHGVARALARVGEENTRRYYLDQALEHGASVRTAEAWASYWRSSQIQTNGTPQENDGEEPPPIPQSSYLRGCAVCGSAMEGPPVIITACPGCAATIQTGSR